MFKLLHNEVLDFELSPTLSREGVIGVKVTEGGEREEGGREGEREGKVERGGIQRGRGKVQRR